MVNFIYTFRRLPVYGIDVKPIFLKTSKFIVSPYAAMPGLNYIIAALNGWIANVFIKNLDLLYIARATSTIFHLVTIYISYKIIEILFKENNFLKYSVPALVAFIPQMTFLGSYINIDMYTIMAASTLIYSLLLAKEKSFNVTSAFFLAISLSMVALSKYNSYVLLPFSFAFLGFYLYKHKGKRLIFLGIAVSLTILLCGWWFTRNARLYKGDVFGLKTQQIAFKNLSNKLKRKGIHLNNRTPFYKKNKGGYIGLITSTRWVELTFKSSWGLFDYMFLSLPNIYYYILWLLVSLAFGGSILTLQIRNKKDQIIMLASLIISIAFIFVSLSLSMFSDFQAQGRYLFPAIVPFLIVFCLGLYNLFFKMRRGLFISLIAFFILLNLISFLYCIAPQYVVGLGLNTIKTGPQLIIESKSDFAQEFRPVANNLERIIVKVKSNDNKGKLSLISLAISKTPGGKAIRKYHKQVLVKPKEDFISWNFKQITNSKNQRYYLSAQSDPPQSVQFCLAREKYSGGKLFINGRPTANSLMFNLEYNNDKAALAISELFKKNKSNFWLFLAAALSQLAIIAVTVNLGTRKEFIDISQEKPL